MSKTKDRPATAAELDDRPATAAQLDAGLSRLERWIQQAREVRHVHEPRPKPRNYRLTIDVAGLREYVVVGPGQSHRIPSHVFERMIIPAELRRGPWPWSRRRLVPARFGGGGYVELWVEGLE